jgi:hypothetical protein
MHSAATVVLSFGAQLATTCPRRRTRLQDDIDAEREPTPHAEHLATAARDLMKLASEVRVELTVVSALLREWLAHLSVASNVKFPGGSAVPKALQKEAAHAASVINGAAINSADAVRQAHAKVEEFRTAKAEAAASLARGIDAAVEVRQVQQSSPYQGPASG